MRPRLVMSCALLLVSGQIEAQLELPNSSGGLFGSVGFGAVSIEDRSGLGVPLSLTLLSPRLRLVGSVTAVEFDLIQERDRNLRYQLRVDNLGRQVCVDTQNNLLVSSFRCSGDVNVVRSLSVDVGIMPTDALLVAGKPGRLYLGIGFRARKPATPYGMIGMLFESPSGRSGGVRLAMGKDYLTVGISWGLDLWRLVRRR